MSVKARFHGSQADGAGGTPAIKAQVPVTVRTSGLHAMRTVVDSNFLQTAGLRAYLSKSPANIAVLTDYAAMEAHKADTLEMLYRSMAILSEFPNR
jgi:hypothetical protein